VLLTAAPVAVVESFTKGFFATQSAFRGTHGYLLDGTGETLSSSRPRGERLDGSVITAVARGESIRTGGRTFVSGRVPSSRWTVVLSVPDGTLYTSVDGATANAAWLLFAAFVAAICALLTLLLLAARGARRLAAANRTADAAAELAYERLHDPLTGLTNRALFAARAEQAVVAARRRGRSVAVVFMDIDHYKLINDSLGHEVGDEVLREVARRLVKSVRGADTVSRFGGDEFVVLCDDLVDAHAALPAVERIRAGLEGPVDVGGRSVPVTFSIGVATGGDGGRSAAELLADADAAMYRAKELGRDRVEIFDAELQRHALVRLDTEVALRCAVEHNELRLHYQPIVDLATERVCGVEALVRWRRPGTEVTIQPAAFIPVAEDIGMIGAIGEWVLRTAVAEVGDWVARGLVGPDFVLSVNVSGRQLADPEFPEQVAAALAGWERPADRLWLEITETAVMAETGFTEPGLESLHALGVGLALDDFGAGYSSLGKLARSLPISILKLDRSFVFGMADRRDHEIVAAAAALATALELSSVAEGVESAEQALAVTGVGFRYAQGFYFGTPADADETVRRLGGGRFSTRRTQSVSP
jgi:diguanylate cyclase (GGDEF)-like protein